MLVDLHCHTTASDGGLSPEALLQRAAEREIDLLAITDHDCIDGYLSVRSIAKGLGVDLVPGIELSSIWGKIGVHIVGLNIDVEHPEMVKGIKSQKRARLLRAEMIAAKLEKKGFSGAYDGAVAEANGSQIGRPHFAKFLISKGYVSSFQQAFKRYLGAGKPGDVKAVWPTMREVVAWITASGGVAVLAHPLHYKMTATKLRALVSDFKEAGGSAIEVVSGKQASDRTQYLASLAEQFDLLASCGSDFHHPDAKWGDLGLMSPLPVTCRPVWTEWNR